MQGVYRIRNKINDKRYVGSAQDFDERWEIHREELQKGVHNNPYLQSAWNRHGEENFVFEIEEEVKGSRKDAFDREQVYLDEGFELGNLYNLSPYAVGGCGPRSEETKQAIGSTMKGMGLIPWNKGISVDTVPPDIRRRIGIANRENSKGNDSHAKPYPAFYNVHTGVVISAGINLAKMCREYGLINMSGIASGAVLETKDGWRLVSSKGKVRTKPPGMKGMTHTEETKQELREKSLEYYKTHDNAYKGKKLPEEHRINAITGLLKYYEMHDGPMKGKHQSDETKAKIGRASLGREVSEETRAILREAGSKLYPAFFNIKTEQFIPTGKNLKQMCTERQLSYGKMYAMMSRTTSQTRDGWHLATPEEIQQYG